MLRSVQYTCMLFMAVFFTACVYDFIPEGLETSTNMVVIEGDITAGDYSYFKISTTMNLTSPGSVAYITNATVWVESENGEKITAGLSSDTPDSFAANTSGLDINKKYKLCVTIPGRGSYESSYLSILVTPQIDSVTYFVGGNSEYVQIEVTSHDYENPERKYYKWSYLEDWEFHVPHMPHLIYNEDLDKEEEIPEADWGKNYYCWSKEYSSGMYIASTEKLSENLIYKQRLARIYPDNPKISYIYSILVSQISLTKEGYIYWEALRKNTDETGGIFAPQPSELKGNIQCITNPEETVLGYISAGTLSQERMYIYAQDIKYLYKDPYNCILYPPAPDQQECNYYPHWVSGGNKWLELSNNHYFMIDYLISESGQLVKSMVAWLPAYCSDCRARNGTKNKPSFWPNTHE